MLGTLLAGQARAVLLNCEKSPAYVPFKLLRMVQRHAKGQFERSQVAPAARGVVPGSSLSLTTFCTTRPTRRSTSKARRCATSSMF